MAAKQKLTPLAPITLEIPIVFNEPVEKPSVYATNLTLQMSEHEVIMSFYEAQPSLALLSPEDLQKTGIRADCVARVTIARGRFESFSSIIQELSKQSKALNVAPK